ncbi:putative NAD(P)H nitroreductase YodC [compost metagenome]
MKVEHQLNDFERLLIERRSVRHYDPDFVISEQELKDMLQKSMRAPSFNNLQPWRFIVFTDPDLKEKLLPIAYNQQQVLEASAVIAFLGDLEADNLTDDIYNRALEKGYMTDDIRNTLVGNIKGLMSHLSPETIKDNVIFDVGLVTMQFMLVAKAHGFDTVAMAGYDARKFAETFNIPKRYIPITLMSVGKALREGHPTVRLSVDEVLFWNGL